MTLTAVYTGCLALVAYIQADDIETDPFFVLFFTARTRCLLRDMGAVVRVVHRPGMSAGKAKRDSSQIRKHTFYLSVYLVRRDTAVVTVAGDRRPNPVF